MLFFVSKTNSLECLSEVTQKTGAIFLMEEAPPFIHLHYGNNQAQIRSMIQEG